MSIITLIRRQIRLARMQDIRLQQATTRNSFIERMSGLSWKLRKLEREHVRDITMRGPSSREIARGITSRAKAQLLKRGAT